ncbi:tryptophan 7-halogenase [Arenicella sp. 4NH20-0111]|uniref:tryptophan halogenase family protein n=1 Tax=Arenicella sp. 4NH20-0111 TaxID=3127648 RepID=UPI0031029E86
MSDSIKEIVIVGGGTAGWLAAGVIAAHHLSDDPNAIRVTLVESSDIPTVGVGEGTWPTMKNTVRSIGIKESDLFEHCSAAFKQGGKFVDWVHGNGDFYYHPFTVPLGYGRLDLAPYVNDIDQFAVEANFQHHVCEAGLAPRTLAENEYSGQCNYAYHLDAGAFAELLKKHCKSKLNVNHIIGTVKRVASRPNGDIGAVHLSNGQKVDGDLFIDCTGFSSLLLGKEMGVEFHNMDHVLFNDSALALHVEYQSKSADIAPHTIATGQNAGWIWDIGLTHRRGVGHVYSSKYLSDDEAAKNLHNYLGAEPETLEPRKISFNSGYRERFWNNNCVAIGMSAGFVEPLEATAIMLVEIAARYVAENMPPNRAIMKITEKRFNEQMDYRWQRIVDFLKLHYMLTKRPEPYWRAHADETYIPDSLKEDLAIWSTRGPISADFDSAIELFPAASYQYVLYGMGFRPNFSEQAYLYKEKTQANRIMQQNHQITQQMLQTLPSHREYIEKWLATTH